MGYFLIAHRYLYWIFLTWSHLSRPFIKLRILACAQLPCVVSLCRKSTLGSHPLNAVVIKRTNRTSVLSRRSGLMGKYQRYFHHEAQITRSRHHIHGDILIPLTAPHKGIHRSDWSHREFTELLPYHRYWQLSQRAVRDDDDLNELARRQKSAAQVLFYRKPCTTSSSYLITL